MNPDKCEILRLKCALAREKEKYESTQEELSDMKLLNNTEMQASCYRHYSYTFG